MNLLNMKILLLITKDFVGRTGHISSIQRGLYFLICEILVLYNLYSSRISFEVIGGPNITTMFLYEVQTRGSMSDTVCTKLLKPGFAWPNISNLKYIKFGAYDQI